MLKGVDISKYQQKVDFDVLKEHVDFVIIRAGFGRGNIDTKAEEYIKKCNDFGIPLGLYWFSYAYTTNMAKLEAKHVCDIADRFKIDLPIFFDFEYDSKSYAQKCGVVVDKSAFNDMTVAFCEEVKRRGYKAGVYYNLDYYNRFVDADRLKAYYIWYAKYSSTMTKPDKPCDIWQWTSTGLVPGIDGHVDVNYMYNEKLLGGEVMETVYRTLNEVPKAYKEEVKELINSGALRGDGKGNINLTESMIRCLLISKRYADIVK